MVEGVSIGRGINSLRCIIISKASGIPDGSSSAWFCDTSTSRKASPSDDQLIDGLTNDKDSVVFGPLCWPLAISETHPMVPSKMGLLERLPLNPGGTTPAEHYQQLDCKHQH